MYVYVCVCNLCLLPVHSLAAASARAAEALLAPRRAKGMLGRNSSCVKGADCKGGKVVSHALVFLSFLTLNPKAAFHFSCSFRARSHFLGDLTYDSSNKMAING